MDTLLFERKRGAPRGHCKPLLKPVGKYHGRLVGDTVVVDDNDEANDLNAFGCFGEFLQRRPPRISVECFLDGSPEGNADKDLTAAQQHSQTYVTDIY